MSGMLSMQRDGFRPIDEESNDIWDTYRESDHIASSGANASLLLDPVFVCYSGKEIVTGELSDDDIRSRVCHAANLMQDAYDRFYMGAKNHVPSAMAVMVVQQCDGSYKLYYHGNMGRQIQTSNTSAEAHLAESFQSQMTLGDQARPVEHQDYHYDYIPCTNTPLADTERITGFRTYFITQTAFGVTNPCYGCQHLTVAFEADDIVNSRWESFLFGYHIFYFWRKPEPDPSIIACRITPYTAAVLVSDIADDVAMEMTLEDAAERDSSVLGGADVKIDPKYRSDVRRFSQGLALVVCERYDSQIAGAMCRRESFSSLQVIARQGPVVASAEALGVAERSGVHLDANIMALISQEVGGRVGLYISRVLAARETLPLMGPTERFSGHL